MIKNRKRKASIEGTILISIAIIALLFVSMLFVFGSAILNWVFDTAIPEFDNLGMVGDTNMTQVSEITLHPLNTFIQNMSWFGVIIYVIGIIGIFGLAFVYRFTNSKWLIPLFICFALIIVLICIFISNIYEEIYTGTDDLSTRLQEQQGLSYLILYSPVIMSIVTFIAGAIMFSGVSQE